MSDEAITSNKRIAKNTLLLYIRMLFTMAVGLYTSRVILATLGIEDYGIYNVVGGFVTMFSVISSTMTTATQRFLSFEIGKGDRGKVRELFSTAVIVHIVLAIIILLFAETIGLWFLNNKMVFPEDRYVASNWVYQLSVLTFMINVISVPYNASLVAYERMAAFAYVSIFEVLSKLGLVYMLSWQPYDKLIVFAISIAVISASIRVIYGWYVKTNFKECVCTWVIDREFGKQLWGFISWNFIGSIASILKEHGLNVVLNLFFGAAVNAARGIAYQVLQAVSGFVSNFQMALNPQIIKHYAANEKLEMYNLIFRGSKFAYLLMLSLSLPIIINAPYILKLWLVDVPNYTVIFLRLVLITTLIDTLSHTLITAVHASGKVKWYQIINGSFLMLTIPCVYLALWLGAPPQTAFIISLIFSIICLFIRMTIIRYTISFPFFEYLSKVIFKVGLVTVLLFGIVKFIDAQFNDDIVSFFVVSSISVLLSIILSYLIALDKTEKKYILKFANSKILRKDV